MKRFPFFNTLALFFPLLIFLSIFSITLTRITLSESKIVTETDVPNKLTGQVISETTCQEPTGGCGTDYYWDSLSCSCVSATSTKTTTCEPQYCGINHYWDESSCSCKCASYVACPTDQYWDVTSCSCLASTSVNTTPTPTTTTTSTTTSDTSDCTQQYCGLNRYWDSASCSCKCASYTACPTNYYWDITSCSCLSSTETSTKTTSETTSCTAPALGCPVNYYWDSTICSCIYSITNLDRLAYETPEVITCVESKLTNNEVQKLRYFIPTNQEGFDEIQKLHDKALDCWRLETAASATAQIRTTLIEKEKCLISSIGENAYRQIYEGRRTPTHNEHLWFEKCYGKVQKDAVTFFSANEKVSSETISCLKKTLGNTIYQEIYSGKADVPPNLQKGVDVCFGARVQPFEQGLSYKIPDTIKFCLNEAVGEEKLSQIIKGDAGASQEEKDKVNLCFAKLNQAQLKFLPPPPEQVPFFDGDESIKFEKADQEKKKVRKKVYGGKLTLSGKAQPNTNVTIYIYSDPIVVTTKTDENGDWVYEMQKPLEEGKHVAYALIRSEDKNYVRSSVVNFDVLAAESEFAPQVFIEEEKASGASKKFIYYSAGAVMLITLIVTGGIYYFYTKRKLKEIEDSSSNGNSKTKSGSGSVN